MSGTATVAWTAFLEEVSAKRRELDLRGSEEVFFRGHGDRGWSLLPSVMRTGAVGKRLLAIESDLFFEFQSQARDLPDGTRSDWDILFAMQHHGTPTRLLDWTDTLGVAVYFASKEADRAKERRPCVWLLNGYALNEKTRPQRGRDLFSPKNLGWDQREKTYYDYGELLLEAEPFDWKLPIAVYPAQRNPRMVAQRGYFTMHGCDLRPIEKSGRALVRCVELPREALPAAVAFLEMAGINEATIFPDLDGQSRWLKRRYGF